MQEDDTLTAAIVGAPGPLGSHLIRWRVLFAFGLALVFLLLAIRGLHINLHQVWSVLQHVDPRFLVLAFVMQYLLVPVRGQRWRLLMVNAFRGPQQQAVLRFPFIGVMEILFLSWFANAVVPVKLGDVYRAYLARTCMGVAMSRTLGTVLAERMLDLLVLFPMLMIAAINVFRGKLTILPHALILALLGGLILAAVALIFFTFLWLFHARINAWLPRRAAYVFTQLRNGALQSLHGYIVMPLALTVCAWLLEGGRFYFVLFALHLFRPGDPAISAAIFLALGSSVLTTLPLTPGGLGVVETFLTAALAAIFLENTLGAANVAASAAVLDRLISYASLVVIGLLVYLFSKKTRWIGVARPSDV